jgi:precorrin-6B methylase 1
MARRQISDDEKIKRQKEVVAKNKSKYESSLTVLEALLKEREAKRNKELLKAISKSNRSYDEIISFLQGEDPGE